jgi:hypothetical protein
LPKEEGDKEPNEELQPTMEFLKFLLAQQKQSRKTKEKGTMKREKNKSQKIESEKKKEGKRKRNGKFYNMQESEWE